MGKCFENITTLQNVTNLLQYYEIFIRIIAYIYNVSIIHWLDSGDTMISVLSVLEYIHKSANIPKRVMLVMLSTDYNNIYIKLTTQNNNSKYNIMYLEFPFLHILQIRKRICALSWHYCFLLDNMIPPTSQFLLRDCEPSAMRGFLASPRSESNCYQKDVIVHLKFKHSATNIDNNNNWAQW